MDEKINVDTGRMVTSIEPILKKSKTNMIIESNGDYSHAVSKATNGNPGARKDVTKVAPLMDAVVKVFCAHSAPNYSLPWQRLRQYSSTSSGFIISGRKVLTNAHSVEHYTQVKLKKRGSDVKYLAKVLAIGNECDIAMLTVEDDEFWEDVSPIEFGSLPALQDAVAVVGYPIGGDTISVTSGVVSRIQVFPYEQGSTELLGLQIDAAINSGNSGGPAFSDKGKCVGIAFQTSKGEDVENMGYVIPTAVVMHFIEDYEKKEKYTGFPTLGFEWQTMENPDLRMSMGMTSDQKGVLVSRIEPTSPEFHVLKPFDVILSFDGIDIANDGTVLFTHGERIGFSYLVSQKHTGDNTVVKIIRDSKIVEVNTKLATRTPLIPVNIEAPSYYIVAGLVFTVVSLPFLNSEKHIQNSILMKLLDKYLNGMAQSEDEQLVVISQVLAADINIGYERIANSQVLAFNGNPVRNLKSLAIMVDKCDDEFMKFELDYQKMVVLQTKTAKKASQDILSTYSIPAAMSSDLGLIDVSFAPRRKKQNDIFWFIVIVLVVYGIISLVSLY
ncbi:hypothetical protein MKW94_029363 [Papaver nudicaule]|uniref:Protease Do-like PDZ domain-containing protein n=1 Tax=Papaver nudicaule TaxID=74823 RepID=A0AA41VJT6_PAPNU|nr:hypothetical protein [Papaver nudicaule]